MSRLDPNWRALQTMPDKRPWNGRQLTRATLEPGDTFFPANNHTLGVVRGGKPIGYIDLKHATNFDHVALWLHAKSPEAALTWAMQEHPVGCTRRVAGESTEREVYAVACADGQVWVWLAGKGRTPPASLEVPR